MKKLVRIGLVMLMGISTVMINGCAKDGAQGPAGANGNNGTNGTNGKDGNANVIGTTTTVSNWTLSSSTYKATISVSGITQDIVDKGVVQVFIQYGTSWWSLPDVNGKNSTQVGFSLGTVTLLNVNSDGSTPTNPGTKVFKVVVISASNLIAHPNTNFKDYESIKSAFNLPD